MGSTPFGELSGSTTLTFVQKDAMVRNAALASLNTTVNYTLALMEGYNTLSEGAGESLHVKSFLPPDQVRAADGAGCVCLGGEGGEGGACGVHIKHHRSSAGDAAASLLRIHLSQ